MEKDQVRQWLQQSLFGGLSEKNLDAVAGICIPRKIQRKQQLFYEGQEGHSLYILAEGTVQLFKTSPEGREIVVKTIGPGEPFGEVVLFETSRYPVSAVALSPGLVLLISRVQVSCLLESESFRRDFIAMLLRKQRYLVDRILNLTAHDVEARFFAFLREHYGEKNTYHIEMSKGDLAAAIGTIPETFSRLTNRLKQEGIITWEGKKLRLTEDFWKTREYSL
jgi:CRP/FNR family transcriptional regulator